MLSVGHLRAQLQGKAKIDSLLKELPKQKDDTNKVKLLNDLSLDHSYINTDEGIKYGEQCLELATKLAWKKGIAMANNSIGVNYKIRSDDPKALEYYFKALKLSEETGNKNGLANVTSNIGNVYAGRSDHHKALEYYFKALKLEEELENKNGIATVTDNIGLVYEHQGNYPKALEYLLKALKLDEELENKNGLASVNCNIGVVYKKQNDYPKALEYYFKGLKLEEAIGDKTGIANVTGNIGNIYNIQKDYPRALEYLLKALKLGEELGNKFSVAAVTGNISTIYKNQKNYTMAVEYSERALKLFEALGSKQGMAVNLCNIGEDYIAIIEDTSIKTGSVSNTIELPESKYEPTASIPRGKAALLAGAIDYLQRGLAILKEIKALENIQGCYDDLSEVYKLKGDYKKAMEYGDSSKTIKDSLFSDAKREQIEQLENKRREFADSLKDAAEVRAAQVKAAHRRNYELIGAGVLVLALVFIFLLSRNNKLLDKEKKQSDSLLHNILPEEIARELKKTGGAAAKQFDDVTVLFTDFVNFTEAGERMKPEALIEELNTCFKAFDEIMGKYNIEKIKTIGDAYLAVAGLPTPGPKHAEHVVSAAKEISTFMADRRAKMGNSTFEVRIGIHSGSVVAGIVGIKKFAYDIWGDTVNTAARMEQNCEVGRINISVTTYELVKDKFNCEYRGEVAVKGKGIMKMYYVG